MVFESKAKTLASIHQRLKTAKTLPVFRFFAKDYHDNTDLISEIQRTFQCDKIAVRSSAKQEDAYHVSNAGAFESILNVCLRDTQAVDEAIKTVLASYPDRNQENELCIQPMLEQVRFAGVAFSCDISTLAPYYVINYDESGKTNAVTSGTVNEVKTHVFYRYYEYQSDNTDIVLIINAVKELELLFNTKYLDVEFAITADNEIYILQVRPIITAGKRQSRPDLTAGLYKVHRKIQKLQKPHPNLLGDTALFGIMPDWNPAEIIGVKPKKLALSLYKELITDTVWANQRNNYGYRDLRSHPLLVSFMGIPFIDVRVDFNSFIPKKLDEKIARKLAEYYLDTLYRMPKYHDKVEFEIVYSCFSLDLPEKVQALKTAGFTDTEIEAITLSLLELTNSIVASPGKEDSLYTVDKQKLEILKKKYDTIVHSDLSAIDKIYWLLEDCKNYGTLPFSGIARSAFIAVQFLKSFVSLHIITQQEYDRYMNSLNTVAKNMNKDLVSLPQDAFLKTWGHIRPGTYDITSLRYDEAFSMYFSALPKSLSAAHTMRFTEKQVAEIDRYLIKYGLTIDAQNLLAFIQDAIEQREYAKFVFTKSLSQVLTLIEQFAKRFGISREDAAFLDIAIIKDMYSELDYRDVSTALQDTIAINKQIYEYTQKIKLPALILNPDDIYEFNLEEDEPNFITLNSIKSEVILEEHIIDTALTGKIVFIESADPGYDFLFTKNIGGLVTQFGGANSHMAIRCAEIGLPAVIGSGEKNFSLWSTAKILEIHCTNKQVRILA